MRFKHRFHRSALAALIVASVHAAAPPPTLLNEDGLRPAPTSLNTDTPHRNPAATIVTCFLDADNSALESLHMSSSTVHRRDGDVVSNLVLESHVTAVGVGVNEKNYVTAVRFFMSDGTGPRCGYWDPDLEKIVSGDPGTVLTDIVVVSANSTLNGPMTADAFQPRFATDAARSVPSDAHDAAKQYLHRTRVRHRTSSSIVQQYRS